MDDNGKSREELIAELNRLRDGGGSERNLDVLRRDGEFLEYGGNEEWQIMMDMLGDFLIVVDTKGSVIKTNPVTSNKLGYSKEELLSMNIFDLYPPDRGAEAEETYSQIIMGERYLCEIPFRAKDGTLIAIETKVTSGKWRGADVIISISRDVSAGKAVEYELRVAFEKMRTIMGSIPVYIWSASIDPRGSFSYIYQSPAVAAITGRFPDYFREGIHTWFDIVHEDERGIVESLYNKIMTGVSLKEEYVYKIYHSGGEIRWVRDNLQMRRFGGGQIRLDGVISDVTERRRAVQALEISESRLKAILSSMADMVFAFDTETRFTFYHTPEMGSIYIEPDKFTTEKRTDILPPEAEELFMNAFQKTRDGGTAEFEYWNESEGVKKCFATKLSSIMNDGIFDGAVAVVRDITHYKTLEEALVLSGQRYRGLFNNIHDGSIWMDMNGRLVDFNQPFENLLGYTREELYWKSIWDIVPEIWHEQELRINREQVLQRGYSDLYRKEYKKKDNTLVPVEVRKYLIRNESGIPEGAWVIANIVPRG